MVTLLYFAWLRERIGAAQERRVLPDGVDRIGALTDWLAAQGDGYAAAFARRDVVRCAVNQVFGTTQTAIRAGDEIAFFPPGDRRLMRRVLIQEAPFDVGAEFAAISTASEIGGVGCFIGQVRGGNGLTAMTLEHYPQMTERAVDVLVSAAEARWALLGCTVIHRVGRLVVGAPIVLVIAASAHRQAALEATRFLIDRLKTDTPFWKCEEFADGSQRWVDAQ